MATMETGRGKRDVARDETLSLIASDKVEGTAVYGVDRQKIGRIDNVMIDKLGGKVAYAVLSFGGFLGLGTEHYPLPWPMLKYDESLGGYLINLSSERFKNAPRYGENENWEWTSENRTKVDRFYEATSYTM